MNAARSNTPGFGAYVHWPYCRKKCPYCDFNSHVSETIDHLAWRKAYEAEIARDAERFGGRDRPALASVFFGGGTPSLMDPETVESVLAALERHFGLARDVEVTLEANPTSVETGKLIGFRSAGVNRVSLGVQSLEDRQLAFLGREHSAREALDAVETAGRLFDRYSFDLIYARPGQTAAQWEAELRRALPHANGHLSVYQLTIEPGTQFQTRFERGDFTLPEDDAGADLYHLTQDILEEAGLPAYEVSNHARPGQECRHNLIYWQSGDWLAVGPGAHGRMTTGAGRAAFRRHRAPAIWLGRVDREEDTVRDHEILTPGQHAEELVMMGLRTRDGVDLDRLSQAGDRPWQDILPEDRRADMIGEGLIEIEGGRLTATRDGLLRLNGLLGYLLA